MKVAVFGDGMIDRYWQGTADRVSPEAPIPVVKIYNVFNALGGAGNVDENLQALGVDTVCNYHCWPIKNRLVVGDYQLARWDENDFCEPVKSPKLSLFDAVVVADYGKGAITPEIIEVIKLLNVPVFVDTKRDPTVWSGIATAIFPNEKEYDQFPKQYKSLDVPLTVMKQGPDGLGLVYRQGFGDWPVLYSPAQARFVKSVNGAGDTVIAAFVYRWLQNRKTIDEFDRVVYQDILDFANAAAAVSVEHSCTYAPTLQEVQDKLEEHYGSNRV